MTNLLKVPSPYADDYLVNLADWVEVKALLESDGNASREDLSRALKREYSIGDSTAEDMAGDVFRELADRELSCLPLTDAESAWEYPFVLNDSGNLLCLRAEINRESTAGMLYTFLLVASRADMDVQRKLEGLDPTVIFEQLCADILLNFWGGRTRLAGVMVFGTARTKSAHKKKFEANIDDLCTSLREGQGLKRPANLPGAGDGKLDIVVWRVFSDGRAGGLVGFAQCKSGIHWKDHLTKLQPRSFCNKYLRKPLAIEPVRVYMVPHRVEGTYWDDHTSDAGLLLDRCRLVQYGYNISKDVFENCGTWLNAALKRQLKGEFTL
jgi:hypothetical protein